MSVDKIEMRSRTQLLGEIEDLRLRLDEAEQALQAIRSGEVAGPNGDQVFSLKGVESVYRAIVETMNEAALTMSPQGTILFSNQRFANLMKMPINEVIGRKFAEFIEVSYHPVLTELIIQAQVEPVRRRLLLLAHDGTHLPAQISASILNAGPMPCFCLIASDLMQLEASADLIRFLRERKEELETSQEQMRLAKESAKLGFFNHDLRTGERKWDEQIRKLCGFEADAAITDEQFWAKVHPEDHAAAKKALILALDPKGIGTYKGEYRLLRREDAALVWIESRGQVFFEEGKPIRLIGSMLDVSERKQAEEALRESELFYRQTLESIPGMVFTTRPDGYCDFQSQQWEDYTGIPMSEHLGDGWNQLLHPDDRPRAFLAWRAAVEGLAPYGLEYRVHRHDGAYEWFRVIGRPIRDTSGQIVRWFGVAMNIEALKQVEQALRTSEARFRSLAESNIIGVVVADPVTGQVFDANDEYLRIIGCSREELLAGAVNWRSSTPPEELSREDALPHRGQREGRVEPFEKIYIHRDGTRVPVIIGGAFLPDEPQKVVAFALDLTAHKLAEEALRHLNETLENTVKERTANLVAANRELEALANQLRLLAGEVTMTEQRERKRLAKILHDGLQQFLVAAKLQVGGLIEQATDAALKQAAIEVESLLQESISVSRSLSAELSPPILQDAGILPGLEWLSRWMSDKLGLNVKLMMPPDAPILTGDVKALLFESVRELLLNVVKHAKTCSATVALSQEDGRSLRITVSDDGQGFNPVSASINSEGFGLFSIRERIGLIGGRLEIDSSPGMGVRVTLTAPLAVDAPLGTMPFAQPIAEDPTGVHCLPKSRGKIRILITDDHAVMREGLGRLLGQETDFEVVGQANDGQEAVQLAEQLLPDVILMDLSMPRMNGIQATRLIRQQCPFIRIIGLSLHEEGELAKEMLDSGAAFYLTKSGPSAELKAAIRNCMYKKL